MWMSVIVYAQTNCVLRKSEDSIFVYTCDATNSAFKAIKVEFKLNATLSQYAATVLRADEYKLWHYKAINPHMVQRMNQTEFYYYTQIRIPWPISNRDMIWRLKLSQDSISKVLTVTLRNSPDFLPKNNGIVRIPTGHSTLTVTPLSPDLVKVNYYIEIDPGGSVPAWLANMFIAQAPWQTFKNLKDRILSQGSRRVTTPLIKDY